MTEAPRALAGVLVAAGRGRRMEADKLWIELYGRPIWRWSLDSLLAVPGMRSVVVVAPADGVARFRDAVPAGVRDRCLVVAGGEARADSVRAGLAALTDAGVSADSVVLVHDAARPAAGTELMERVAGAVAGDAAIPVLPVADTLKRVTDGRADQTVEREGLGAAQTPQAASLGSLVAALDAARARSWEPTDEAAALAAIGVAVHAVAGDPSNRKLTEWTDVDVLRGALRSRVAPMDELNDLADARGRVGIGVDAHRLEAGRPLHLGGLAFPDEPLGLVGHSDGDVALHAVIDALLGAAGLGDIGLVFPATDATLDADSADLLHEVGERVRAAGWEPRAVDIAIAAVRPALAPRAMEMAARVGELVGLPGEAITVRGTTTDGLGFSGAEGIAAWAVAVVAPR